MKKVDKIIKEIDLANKKMTESKKASDVNHVFDKMDPEVQEAVKSLINHLMITKTKKQHGIK